MAKSVKLPEGFVLDQPNTKASALPEGFVLDQVSDVDTKTKKDFSEAVSRETTEKPSMMNYAVMGPMARGLHAVQEGAKPSDVPAMAVDLVSSLIGDMPQQLAKRPLATATAGAMASSLPEEKNQIPMPEYTTEAGEKFGKDLAKVGYAIGATELVNAAVPLAKAGIKTGVKALKKATTTPEKALAKAQKLTTEILQPSKTELIPYYERGMELPAVEEATKVISKAKNYGDLIEKISTVKRQNMLKRNKLILSDNYNVGPEYLRDLEQLIRSKASDGVTSRNELKTMAEVYKRQLNFIKQRGGKITRMQAQKLKEDIDDNIMKTLQSLSEGKSIIANPAEDQALASVRLGLKKIVQGGNPEIEALDATYGGLKRAQTLLAGQKGLATKSLEQGLLGKIPIINDILNVFLRPSQAPFQVTRMAGKMQRQLPKTTRQINELYELYQELSPKVKLDYSKMKASSPRISTKSTKTTKMLESKAKTTKALSAPETVYGEEFTMKPYTKEAQMQAEQAALEGERLKKFKENFVQPISNIRSSSHGGISQEIADILARYYARQNK